MASHLREISQGEPSTLTDHRPPPTDPPEPASCTRSLHCQYWYPKQSLSASSRVSCGRECGGSVGGGRCQSKSKALLDLFSRKWLAIVIHQRVRVNGLIFLDNAGKGGDCKAQGLLLEGGDNAQGGRVEQTRSRLEMLTAGQEEMLPEARSMGMMGLYLIFFLVSLGTKRHSICRAMTPIDNAGDGGDASSGGPLEADRNTQRTETETLIEMDRTNGYGHMIQHLVVFVSQTHTIDGL